MNGIFKGDNKMKYLVGDLKFEFFAGNTYDKNEDKFLIGIQNSEKTKLKDVVTGQVVDASICWDLSDLKSSDNCGQGIALRLMVGFKFDQIKARHMFEMDIIDSILKRHVISERQIATVKRIMNREINLEHKNAQKRSVLEEKLGLTEEERDF